ncbi:adenosylcobinamide-GDP ribazoletransferase [Pseudoroseicyclus tamaricis]|uniref:Adenosylcobinamide-GDP ribazoletransferase n=1 Tax=Pseudoroseicyclus tamaricis TaxID=2705421 RepID=A0A6B2JYF0_9RHOB|nr:adenosylcobinamide-GDP ribazoletransferase [Pseudoroseicyclus tamaricis]NDV00392.1 adenosylcobinamide-GDP ribazoletransferase [Pseudoroseicyclus tamaricis]
MARIGDIGWQGLELRDIGAALGLLTRLPVGRVAHERGAKAAWAYPVAGLAVGLVSGLAGAMALWLGLTPALAAVTVLAAQALGTGALHEDGLADTADGLWGGWDKARRLEIMRDSRTGAYGVLALVLVTLARFAATEAVIAAGLLWPALLAVPTLARGLMAAVMAALPPARADGLSHGTGRPGRAGWLGLGLGALWALLMLGVWAVPVALAAGAAVGALALLARAKIGGQTGDILGACCLLAELGGLAALVALA